MGCIAGNVLGFRDRWQKEERCIRRGQTTFKAERRTPGQASSGALFLVEFDLWSMLACYVPGANSKGLKLRQEIEAKAGYFVCREVARGAGTRPLLIIGDLNTGNQTGDKTPNGVNYACAEHFDDLSGKYGLVDLWRSSNGTDAREWTKRTTRNGLILNGFRLDHAFGNSQVRQCVQPHLLVLPSAVGRGLQRSQRDRRSYGSRCRSGKL